MRRSPSSLTWTLSTNTPRNNSVCASISARQECRGSVATVSGETVERVATRLPPEAAPTPGATVPGGTVREFSKVSQLACISAIGNLTRYTRLVAASDIPSRLFAGAATSRRSCCITAQIPNGGDWAQEGIEISTLESDRPATPEAMRWHKHQSQPSGGGAVH